MELPRKMPDIEGLCNGFYVDDYVLMSYGHVLRSLKKRGINLEKNRLDSLRAD